ncbi:MAG: tRNA (adenosine(37)-N6)-threonylcarbamoyltransferase complex dimerization subunit type 1 TsaB [Oscillospiraceae bacterium]|nr:tRNA (adenosine(37)-N6)-threonylcarbamoyltransferase complex dimerization subunit type 1 TsaB [Oscillospiraceae bacterium]
MTILALETSSKAASCALAKDGLVIGEAYVNAGLTHSQTIMPMVADMLLNAAAALADTDVFAVSAGPGSFTGLRIAIAAVKGMAMALNRPCAAVSTLHGLAVNAQIHKGLIAPVLDARRDQVYTALFRSDGQSIKRLADDEALSLDDLQARLSGADAPVLLVGDGATLCMERLKGIDNMGKAPEHMLYQRASSVCAVAADLARSGKLVGADALSPVYIRLPQAERELAAKRAADEGAR